MALKRSSEVITVSGTASNATNGFEVAQFDLQLNPLDQEVFVVQAVQIDFNGNSPLPVTTAPLPEVWGITLDAALSSTRPASQPSIANSSTFAIARQNVRGTADTSGQPTSYFLYEQSSDVPDTNLDYIAIIATSDFFVATTDTLNNQNNTQIAFRIWGYRAKADAATYAALVQSEVLSS